MRNTIIAVGVALALLLSAGVVIGQGGRKAGRPGPPPAAMAPGGGMGMGMGMCGRIAKELKLTPDQIKLLEPIRKDFMDSTQSARDDIKAKMKQMLDLWAADQPDAAAIKDLASQMEPSRTAIRESAIDHVISALAVLTPEQRAKVKDWVKKNPGMCMGMACGMCGGGGMGMDSGMGCGMGAGMGQGKGAVWVRARARALAPAAKAAPTRSSLDE